MHHAAVDLTIQGKAGRLAVRTKGLDARPAHVVVLVQGANLTGQCGYDFAFAGGEDYSMMDMMVARGIGAVTFSVRGYGKSDCPADPLAIDTHAAIEDLASVVDWIAAQGLPKPHLAGWSWGGRISGMYAGENPGRVARLALLDPALGGVGPIGTLPTDAWWEGGWQYFHDRLEAEFTDEAARRALADYVVAREPRSPNGIRRENAIGSPATDPKSITCPTLMIYGSAAAKQDYMQGGIRRMDFFEALPTTDKTFVIVPDCGDYAHFQRPRHRFAAHIADFLLVA